MPQLKLTKRAIERLAAPDPSGKQRLVWDSELRGFGVLVSGKTTARSFVVQREVNGRDRRVTIGSVEEFTAAGKTVEDARKEAADLLLRMRHGEDPKAKRGPAANTTLRAVLDDFLRSRSRLAESSRAHYRALTERWLAEWLDMPLRQITPEMVERKFRSILENVKATAAKAEKARVERAQKQGDALMTPDRQMAPGAATANGVMRIFRALWNDAADRIPDLPANPVSRLRRQWFAIRPRERHVAADDLAGFYKAVQAYPSRTMRDYLKLLLFTGLRRREAAGLRWADIDFSARLVRLPAKATKAKRKLNLPMSDFVHDLLVARRGLGFENEFIFPAEGKSGHLVEPLMALIAIGKACGVRVSPHDLRRTFITVASQCAMPAFALVALVNHAPPSGVTGGYAQISVEQLRGPAQAVADRMKAYCKITAPEGVERLRR